MAELILSEEEKQAATYLEWDDAALGKAVKNLALDIGDTYGTKATGYTACATMLACMVAEKNSAALTMDLKGITDREQEVGDWRITIRRLSEPKQPKDCAANGVALVWQSSFCGDETVGVFYNRSEQVYFPFCRMELGAPCSTEAAARRAAYEMLQAMLVEDIARHIEKIPRTAD